MAGENIYPRVQRPGPVQQGCRFCSGRCYTYVIVQLTPTSEVRVPLCCKCLSNTSDRKILKVIWRDDRLAADVLRQGFPLHPLYGESDGGSDV